MTNGELSRQAAAIAARRGWQVVSTAVLDDEVRLVVTGPDMPFDAVLAVRADVPEATAAAEREVRARREAHSEHVVGVLEVLAADSSRRNAGVWACLLEHAPGGSLEHFLGRRGGTADDGVRPHEATTILAGVASGLGALHAAGWAHGRIGAAAVVFRRDGCPALDALDRAEPLDRRSAERDKEAFQRLVETVCVSVPSPESWRMLTAASGALARGGWHDVVEALTAVAEPGAVIPGSAQPISAIPASGGRRRRENAEGPASPRPPVGIVETLLEGNPVAELMSHLRAALARRRRLVLALAAPLAVAALLLALIPPQGGSPRAAHPQPAAATTGSAGTSPTPGPTTGRRDGPSAPASASPDVASARERIRGDDPVRAAEALLAARHRCFLEPEPSPDCLAAVLQRGSGLAAAEIASLGSPAAADQRAFDGATFTLVQRWGDAALVACAPDAQRTPEAKPASLLLVRGEAGWRLRDVLEG